MLVLSDQKHWFASVFHVNVGIILKKEERETTVLNQQ